jgi:hypothetical protein
MEKTVLGQEIVFKGSSPAVETSIRASVVTGTKEMLTKFSHTCFGSGFVATGTRITLPLPKADHPLSFEQVVTTYLC